MIDRDHRSGQYVHGLDKICACGATKGRHMAVAPYDLDETNCLGFKLAKQPVRKRLDKPCR